MSDELGFNKIAGAILATALAFIGIREVAHAAYHSHQPDVPAYGAEILAEAQAAANASSAPVAPLPFPQADWVSAMDAAAGEKVFAKCKSCHGVDMGGAAKTGPNLHGIVGAPAAQRAGFKYSSAMVQSDITWNYEELNDYLTKPSKYVKGTAMSFAGLKKPEQRAAIIEYLRVNGSESMAKPSPAPGSNSGPEAAIETVIEAELEVIPTAEGVLVEEDATLLDPKVADAIETTDLHTDLEVPDLEVPDLEVPDLEVPGVKPKDHSGDH